MCITCNIEVISMRAYQYWGRGKLEIMSNQTRLDFTMTALTVCYATKPPIVALISIIMYGKNANQEKHADREALPKAGCLAHSPVLLMEHDFIIVKQTRAGFASL